MERSYISELKAGESVVLKGWIYEIRSMAKMAFLLLRDSSGFVQCIAKDEKIVKEIAGLTLESVVEIRGKIKKAEVKAELARKDVEVEVEKLVVLNKAENLPIHVNEKTVVSELPLKLDWRTLSLRTPRSRAIFKVQAKIIEGVQEYLNKNGFLQVFTPCLM